MNFSKRILAFGVVILGLAGCGAGMPVLQANPATLSLSQGTALQVTIADGNYNDTVIQLSGGINPQTIGYACTGGSATYFVCNRSTVSGTSASCTTQQPCTIIISATRGGNVAYATVNVVN